MKKNYQLEQELFPILKQLLTDAFHLDSILFKYPYGDMSAMDRGLRKAIFKEYDTNPASIKNLGAGTDGYSLVIIQSTLKFYNIVVFFPVDENPDILSVGPFRYEEVSTTFLQEVIQSNHLSTSQLSFLRQFYQTLPLVDVDDVTNTLFHLLQSFIPDFRDTSPVRINFSEIRKEVKMEPLLIDQFSSEYSSDFDKYMKETVLAVKTGDTTSAMQAASLFLSHIGINQITNISKLKKYNSFINYTLFSATTDTYVHAHYAMKQMAAFDSAIDGTQSYRTLQHMPFDIVHKYTILIKNYSHQQYSHLVRSIRNYIDLHLEEELTLVSIAEFFHKNPSYISTTFKEETGIGLSNYIATERIHAAVRLLNTTNMSVADVSAAVGIQDFGYFTKVFKKQIGQTPTEYRKMMR